MYFFSHYYTERHLSDPHHLAGLLLPDLLRDFTPVYHHLKRSGAEGACAEGIMAHYEGDRRFHASAAFRELEKVVLFEILDGRQRPSDIRMSLIAHLLTEMLLDRALLSEHYEHAGRFERLLAEVNGDLVCRELARMGSESLSASFADRFSRFRDSRVPFRISEAAALADSLNRTYIFVCKVPMPAWLLENILRQTDELTEFVRLKQDALIPSKALIL
jgi:hypothetical protein